MQRHSDVELSSDEPTTSASLLQVPPVITPNSLDSMCGSIVAHLQASGVPESTVQTIVSSMEEVVSDVQIQTREAVFQTFSAENKESEMCKKIEHSLNKLDNPFSKLNTETKRKKYFSEKWDIVEPKELVLGVRLDTRRDRPTGVYSQIPVTDKYMYVPILGTLKSIFKNSEIIECFLQEKPSKTGMYQDINDGLYFQNHPLFSQHRHALQILLYYDDFETANPLGSKKGIHKLGCVYFTLKNLPPKLNSVLMNVHLAALFYTEDLKTYGFDLILKPLIDDLKILETTGIQLPFINEPLFGSVIQITGDNLALNGLLGFVESFSATYCCRFCLTNKEEIQSVFTENNPGLVLRSKELYVEHCNALSEDPTLPSVYGVKKACVLNSLHYFHSSDNYTVDIMHDLLEGVVQYELKLFFQYLIKNGYASIKTLLHRVQSFNYGFLERKNKPSGLKIDDNSKHLGINAIQSLCILRNTPLIFGDIVERDNKHWNLVLLLLHIVNIVFSPIFTDGMICYLKHLICDHHTMFKTLFPDKRLIPKHHLMIHYPRLLKKIGPLIHMWCMRFEAKHIFFKKSKKNFKNFIKSLVNPHQRQQAFYFENYYFKRFEFGPLKTKTIDSLKGGELLCQILLLDPCSHVSTTSWVRNYGTEYQKDLFICTGTSHDLPVFKKICNIIIHDQRAFIIGCTVDTLYFDEHFHAYCIEEQNNDNSLICIDQLTYFKPFDKQYSNDGEIYIVPYCHMF